MEDRITELESRQAFLEHTINKLNDVVTNQDASLRKLEQQNKDILQQVQDLGETVKHEPQDEAPPHY